MKKLTIVSIIILSFFACKKTEFTAIGPTDVRIRNLSDQTFNELIVTTSTDTADTDTIGNISPDGVSEYFRFTKAYQKAEISAKINGVVYSTGHVDFTYMHYIGQDRITYEVYISNTSKKELTISNLIIEEPIPDLK